MKKIANAVLHMMKSMIYAVFLAWYRSLISSFVEDPGLVPQVKSSVYVMAYIESMLT